jgi:hypothetical protein
MSQAFDAMVVTAELAASLALSAAFLNTTYSPSDGRVLDAARIRIVWQRRKLSVSPIL